LFIGETYLAMITSIEKPAFKITIPNLMFLARNIPLAKYLARRELRLAEAGFREVEAPSHLARALYKLGVLDRHTKRRRSAAARFADALALAKSVGADALARAIENDMAVVR
jgi:hypothetical protein